MEKKLILPCLRGLVGDWVFYSTLMSASEIATWIKPVKNIREAESLDEVLQRDLKDRKKAIARYLLNDKNRFFNSIVVGVFGGVPDWFEFDLSKTNKVIPLEQVETIKQSVGLMVFSGSEQMFAIDGQHRVAGIQIAVNDDKLKILADDQFSVILVAHVDDNLGMKRTRKLFSDINKNAKPVAGGDKIKIDEEDLCSIVTRRVYANYSYFNGGKLISLTENAKLEKDDTTHFTNLLGLHSTNKVLKKLFKRTPKTQDWDEVNVVALNNIVEEFYDFVIQNVTDYRSYFIDKTLNLVNARKNNSYLLFRPIGLKLLAGIYVHYKQKQNGLELMKAKINGLSFTCPNSPFNMILWNNGKMEAKEASQKLALELSLYLFGELPNDREDTLLIKYRELLKSPQTPLPTKL
jgi:DNA sulfur modification protein DndB